MLIEIVIADNGNVVVLAHLTFELLFLQLNASRLMYVCACMFVCVPMQVKMLVESENGKLRAALVANLKSAVTASFLMLPESFSEEDLFLQIASLSYAGNYFSRTKTRGERM